MLHVLTIPVLQYTYWHKPQTFMVGVYPLHDGRVAAVLCGCDGSISAQVGMEMYASYAMHTLPELQGKHPEKDVVWFVTAWTVTLQCAEKGDIHPIHLHARWNQPSRNAYGRKMERIEFTSVSRRSGLYAKYGWKWSLEKGQNYFGDERQEFLLHYVEAGYIQNGGTLTQSVSLKDMDICA